MIVQYKDVLLKAAYYKDLIVKDLVRQGEMITDSAIENRLKKIDHYVSILSYEKALSGESVDAKRLEKDLEDIYRDLLNVYRITYEETVKEYEYVRNFIDAHLRELESLAEAYRIRSEIEINSTSLGETVFFKSNGFPLFTKDNYGYVDLGSVIVREGSLLSLLVEGANVKPDNIVMGLKRNETIDYIAPHNYLQDTYRVAGSSEVNNYKYKLDENLNVNTSFELKPEDLKVVPSNSYVILGGLNHISVTENHRRELVSQDDDYAFLVKGDWAVRFYIQNGTYAKFQFSRPITNKNFEGHDVINLKKTHKFEMSSDADFGFTVITDGEIYAEKERGVIEGEKLLFPRSTQARDFLVKEITPGKEVKYDIFLKIKSDTDEYPQLKSVALKELSEVEGLYSDIL